MGGPSHAEGDVIEQHFIDDTVLQLRKLKELADKALQQIQEDHLFAVLDPEANSIAVIMKHMAGNMRSRWTDFLTTDGEKPDRRRDFEFVVEPGDSRASLVRRWEEGWAVLAATLGALRPEDLDRTVRIRTEPLPVFDAIERQKEHYAYHVGQVVFLAKHFAGPAWKSLSVPRGGSEAHDAEMRARHAGRGS